MKKNSVLKLARDASLTKAVSLRLLLWLSVQEGEEAEEGLKILIPAGVGPRIGITRAMLSRAFVHLENVGILKREYLGPGQRLTVILQEGYD